MLLATILLSVAASVLAQSASTAHQKCPEVHILGARGTTAPPGYGIGQPLVTALQSEHPAWTAEPIEYPACGGGAACGGIPYGQSVDIGTAAVLKQIKTFAQQCPGAKLVLIGDSQGSQILDNALCNLKTITSYNIKAVVFMGNPRFRAGDRYNRGTCKLYGFAARPVGQQCGSYNHAIRSYCDDPDPYCCKGHDGSVHTGYAMAHKTSILKFINRRVNQ